MSARRGEASPFDGAPDRLRFGAPLRDAALAAAAFALDAGALAFWILLDRWYGALPHIALAAALAAFTRREWRAGRDIRIPALLTLATAFCGPAGALGCLVCLGLALWFARQSQSFEEWFTSLFPVEEHDGHRALMELVEAVGQGREPRTNVSPLMDILAFGTHPQKQAVVTLISRSFRPTFAPALKRAISDPVNAIRVQAASAITSIEGDFLKRTIELTARQAAAPGDPALLLDLARHYDDYAFTGILDPSREKENQGHALNCYRRYVELDPRSLAGRRAVGRLLLRQGRLDECELWLRAALEEGIHSNDIVLWRMECLFRLGAYGDLRALAGENARALTDSESLPVLVREAIWMWVGDAVMEPEAA